MCNNNTVIYTVITIGVNYFKGGLTAHNIDKGSEQDKQIKIVRYLWKVEVMKNGK